MLANINACNQRIIILLTGLSAPKDRVYNMLFSGCPSSDWLLTKSLSGIRSSCLRETGMVC